MFILDAELKRERCNFEDLKTKSEIKKELEDSIANSNKNKQSKKIVHRAKKVRQKLFTNLKKSLNFRGRKCYYECQRFLICIVLKNVEQMAKNCIGRRRCGKGCSGI